MLPVGSDETPLYFYGGCDDTPTSPLPPSPPVAQASMCVPSFEPAPRIESVTPGTVRIRSELPLTLLWASAERIGDEHRKLEVQPTVTRRDDFLWNVSFPVAMPPEFKLSFQAESSGPVAHTYLARFAAPATSVEVVKAGLRGTTVTAVVRASVPGRLDAYVSVNGRRRSAAVATDAGAGTTRLRIRLARRPGEALRRRGGVAIRLDPANGAPRVRAWKQLAQP